MAKRKASYLQLHLCDEKACKLEISHWRIPQLLAEKPIEFMRKHKDLIDDYSTLQEVLEQSNKLCKKYSAADDAALLELIVQCVMRYHIGATRTLTNLSMVIRKRVKLKWAESLFVLRPCFEQFGYSILYDSVITDNIRKYITDGVGRVCDGQPPLSFCFDAYSRMIWISTWLYNNTCRQHGCGEDAITPVQCRRIFSYNAFFASELLCDGVGAAILGDSYLSLLPMDLRQGKLVGHIMYAQLGHFVWHKIAHPEKLFGGIPKRTACRVQFASSMRAPPNGWKYSRPVPRGAGAFSCVDEQDDLSHYYWVTDQAQYYTSELREMVKWQDELEHTEFMERMRSINENDY